MTDLCNIALALQSGRAQETTELIFRALKENCPAERILKEGLMAGIAAVEEKYGREFPFTPEMLFAGRALNAGIGALRSSPDLTGDLFPGTVIVGTVKNDLYDIEKNLCCTMMEILGLRVIDLGVSVDPERFIEAAAKESGQIISCAAALPSLMPHLKEIVQAAEAAGIRDRVKIMICGRPVTEPYRACIGADLFAPDVISAAELAAAHCRSILSPAA